MTQHISKKILITVKTYPTPSKSYKEVVCTAGICEDGSMIRLYPIAYRYLNGPQQFNKYEIVSVDVEKNKSDPRPESYKPYLSTLIHHKHLKTGTERENYVESVHCIDMCDLNGMERTKCSLAITKPKKVLDFIVRKDSPEWSTKQKQAMQELWLDGPAKHLEKIPYKFYYKYKCHNLSCTCHEQSILDWELSQLFLKMRRKYQSDNKAIEMVRKKYLDQMCSDDRDTYFFVGTHSTYNSWMVLGVYWPKKRQKQFSLI